MKEKGGEILIFAGTTEGRRLSGVLAASGVRHTVCVATEYGKKIMKEHPLAKLHQGRMDSGQIFDFLQNGAFRVIVDATHPYAAQVTENIRLAARRAGLPCLRLLRERDAQEESGTVSFFDSHEACARALERQEGNILLTTGSRELEKYCGSEELRRRLFVRVLPSGESILACQKQGLEGRQILAMQGPFGAELNAAIIRQYGISCLVTKDSGRIGGFEEKLEAAERTGIPAFVVGRPREEEGLSFAEVAEKLEELCKCRLKPAGRMEITLAGAGMGGLDCLTEETRRTVAGADLLLGAPRLLKAFPGAGRKEPFYRAEQIIPFLEGLQKEGRSVERAAVLFSGDSGFYSGCRNLLPALQREVEEGRLDASVRVLPGISSVSCLAACLGASYEDAAVVSLHGKWRPGLMRLIRRTEKTFLLTSGVKDINRLGSSLVEAGLSGCEIWTGRNLSTPEQSVRKLTPRECCSLTEEGLYTCLVRNPSPMPESASCGLPDESFIRGSVPMTKEEIREISICKLRLQKNSTVYDIGGGTGSVSVEMARLSDEIQVFSIEQKEEAAELIERNREKFLLDNLTVVRGRAPECLTELPPATHAFIGGSGRGLPEILDVLYRINSRMRVVINAVTLETAGRITEILNRYPVEEEEVVQVQVSRAGKAGAYHLMRAENPVWICAFRFRDTAPLLRKGKEEK